MANYVGRMEARLGLDRSGFKRGLEAGRKDAQGFARGVESTFGGMASRLNAGVMGLVKAFAGPAGVVAAVGVAVSATVGKAAEMARGIAQIGDEARRAGVSAQAFQEWKFVAEQNRIGVDQMIDGLKELNLRADEFVVTGKGPAAEAFARLGYSSLELKRKLEDPSALLLEIIGRLEGLDSAAQIRIADEIFGGSAGERFVELLGQGEDGIRQTINRAHDLGLVLDDELIAKADRFDRAWSQAWAAFQTNWKASVVTVATDLADAVAAAREAYREFAEMAGSIDFDGVTRDLENGSLAQLPSLAYGAVNALFELSGQLDAIEQGDAAEKVDALVAELEALAIGANNGSIGADELRARLGEAGTQAEILLGELQSVNGVDLTGAQSAVGALMGVLGRAAAAALQLRAAMPGPVQQIGPSTRGGKRRAPEPTSAPAVSIRPQFRPMDLGDKEPSGGGRGAGRAKRDEVQAFLDLAAREVSSWQEKLDLIGKSESATAALTAKNKLLNEAKRRGIDLDTVNAKTGETLREEIERQSQAIGELAQKYEFATERAEFMDDVQKTLKDGILDAAVAGGDLSDVLGDLAKSLKRAALEALLFGSGPFSGGSGGGAFGGLFGGSSGGGLLGGLLGGLFGGFRAAGGPVEAGKAYVVGEKRPEVFVPDVPGRIIPSLEAFDAKPVSAGISGAAGATGSAGRVDVYIHPSGEFDTRTEGVAVRVMEAGLTEYHRGPAQELAGTRRRG